MINILEFEKELLNNKSLAFIIDDVKSKISEEDSTIKMDCYYQHILYCAYYARKLADSYNCNFEIYIVASLLHDIARTKLEWISSHEIY